MRELTADSTPPVVRDRLGRLSTRFSHHDQADTVLGPGAPGSLAVVTGFGPTNAPTAGTLSVMLGIVELQHRLNVPVTVIISELGAWNSRNVSWDQLLAVRDRMFGFLGVLGFDERHGVLRSHLDFGNLTRAGRIARFLDRQDLLDNRESLVDLYEEHGLLGTEVGLTVDTLYTIADILGPADAGASRILMVSGLEEAYFTDLARLVLTRQATAGELSLGWTTQVGALYFRVLGGLGGYPKMSKSIPDSCINLGMSPDEIAKRVLSDDEVSQPALMSAVELSSGWNDDQISEARTAFADRNAMPQEWRAVKTAYLDTFLRFAHEWDHCAR
jgi:tryptophanyl-tRNA synthetase